MHPDNPIVQQTLEARNANRPEIRAPRDYVCPLPLATLHRYNVTLYTEGQDPQTLSIVASSRKKAEDKARYRWSLPFLGHGQRIVCKRLETIHGTTILDVRQPFPERLAGG